MPGFSFYDRQHVQKVLAQQSIISNIFNQFILSVSPYLRQWSDTGNNSVWVRNQSIEKAVDRELLTLESMLNANILAFQNDAWTRSNTKNDDFIRKYIEGLSISTATKEGMFSHNLSALKALQNSTDANGLRVSDRVWNITQQAKSQLEFYLDSGVSVGRNANGISSDIRQLLHDPNKRFRRVRNEEGKLVPSQPMKNYHPGQGVYRSAYMNALRTSATTTNTAYRSADYERWSKQDFTLGIEIHRSANHKGPCKICDAMVGKYPKTFKFTGFHPFCICFATPIVMEPEDFADYLFTDEVPEKLIVTSIPQRAQEFVKENKDGLKSTYWYKDNFDDGGKLQRQIISTQVPIQIKKQEFNFSARTPQEAIDYIKAHIADSVSLEIKKGDLPVINDIINQIQRRMVDFSMPRFKNFGKPSGNNALASWDGHDNSINFNLSKLKNTSSIWKKESAWKKKGIKYSPFAGEDDIRRCIIDHELGHKIFGQYDMSMDAMSTFGRAGVTKNGINEINDIIGYYASTDLQEYFAEAFAMFMGPEKNKLGKETAAMMERLMVKVNNRKINSTYKMVCSDASAKLKPTSIKEISHIQSKMERIVSEHPEYFPRGYKGITAVSREHAYMSTDINGDIIVNFATDKNGFNAGESLVSAFDKIKKGVKLTEHEEYSVEVLWHEVLHNKSKNTAVLPDINSPSGFSRTVAETVNQLVARHSYNDLLKQLGSSAKHKAWVLDNGYGYKEMVSNLRALISKAGINEKAFVREANKVLMEDYTDIDVKIKGLLKRMYKGDKDVARVFDMIEVDNFSRFLKILD